MSVVCKYVSWWQRPELGASVELPPEKGFLVKNMRTHKRRLISYITYVNFKVTSFMALFLLFIKYDSK